MLQQLEAWLRQLPWLQEAIISHTQLQILAFTVFLSLFALLRILRGRKHKSALRLLFIAAFLALITLCAAIVNTHFAAYKPLHLERQAARLAFTPLEGDTGTVVAQLYLDSAHAQAKQVKQWPVEAKQWQLTVRVVDLGWPWRNSKQGPDYYCFKSFVAIEQQVDANASQRAFRLPDRQTLDIWKILHNYFAWLPGLSTQLWQTEIFAVDTENAYLLSLHDSNIQVQIRAKVDTE